MSDEEGNSGSEVSDSPKKPKKKHKKKTTGPKRARTAYVYYTQQNRKKVQEENPAAKFPEMGKILGANWKKMTAEEKEPYEALAKKDKERYSEEKRAAGGSDVKPKTKGKKRKATGAPKKPLSSFVFWSKENRPKIIEEIKSSSFAEVGKLLGERWRALTDEEKTPYVKMNTEAKAKYKGELEKWETEHPEEAAALKEKKKKKKSPKKKAKPQKTVSDEEEDEKPQSDDDKGDAEAGNDKDEIEDDKGDKDQDKEDDD